MDNFLGTKGNWYSIYNGNYHEVKRSEDHLDGRCLSVNIMLFETFINEKGCKNITESDEGKANALLISKAPEMLEMLEKSMSILGNVGEFEIAKEIENLIKEATTI